MRPILLFGLALLLAVATASVELLPSATPFRFEVAVASSVSGRVQVFYDIGRGFNEGDSASIAIAGSTEPTPLALPLPAGRYLGIRFDPIDTTARVTFAKPRIADADDNTVMALPPAEFVPNEEVAGYSVTRQEASFHVSNGGNDPWLTATFKTPQKLQHGWWQRLSATARTACAAFFGWLILLLLGTRAWSHRAKLKAWAHRRPHGALWIAAALSGVVASYPVVFAGKSFVSPNITALLRPAPPTIPGYTDLTTTELHVPDAVAMMWQDVPYSITQAQAVLHDHELPLWNRYLSCGVTLLGQGQSMLGDPVHLLVIAAGGASWAWDVKFVVAKILFAVGVALSVWLLTDDLMAALIIAVGAPFVAFFNFRFNHPAVFSVSYAPWVFAAWMMILRAETVSRLRGPLVCWLIANIALLGSGTAKEAYMLSLTLNACGALIWCLRGRAAPRWRHAAVIAAAIACGTAITMPLWLPFFDALHQGTNVYQKPTVWQAPRAWVVGVFDSLFYVETNAEHRGFIPSANFLVLLGFLFAIAQPVRRLVSGAHLVVLLLASLVCVAIAHAYVPAAWIAATPVLRNVYHVHNTFDAVAVVLLTIIGGCGFHAARHSLRAPGRAARVAVGTAVVAALLFAYFHDLRGFFAGTGSVAGWLAGVRAHAFFFGNLAAMVAAGAVLILLASRRLRQDRTSPGAAVLALLALAVLLYRHGLHLQFGYAETYLTFPMVRADLAAPSPGIEAARADAAGLPFRALGTNDHFINGWNTVYHVESLNGPDAIMNRDYRDFVAAAGLVDPGDWRFHVTPASLVANQPVLDFLGTRYIITDAAELPGSRYTKLGTFDVEVFRSATAWPRALFANRVTVYRDLPQFVASLRNDSGRPFAAIAASDLPAARATPGWLKRSMFTPPRRASSRRAAIT